MSQLPASIGLRTNPAGQALQGSTGSICSTRLLAGRTKCPEIRRARKQQCYAAGTPEQPEASGCQTRRSLLTAGAVLFASTLAPALPASADLKKIPVKNLTSFNRSAIKDAFRVRCERALGAVLTADDAPAALRLLLHDAGTYDAATGQGGVDGSIFYSSEEAGRPENRDLAPLMDKLRKAKKEIDAKAGEGQAEASYADLELLAVKVATRAAWRRDKIARSDDKDKGAAIADNFGAAWPVTLGRQDRPAPGPNRLPPSDASPEAIKTYMRELGAANKVGEAGFFGAKPPFWERPAFLLWSGAQPDPAAAEQALAADPDFAYWKKNYDRSRKTVTRTGYEVDFIEYVNKLAGLGATFAKDAYLYEIELDIPSKF